MADIYDELLDSGNYEVPGVRTTTTEHSVKPSGAAQQPDVYDTILDDVQANQRTQLQKSLEIAVPKQPDTQAKAQALAKANGLPIELVERNLQAIEERSRVRELQSLLADSPFLARQMTDPEFAKLAHDDYESLSALDKAAQVAKNIGRAGAAGIYYASEGVTGWAQALAEAPAPLLDPLAGTVLPENPLRRVASGISEYRKGINSIAEGLMPKSDSVLGSGFYSGISSIAHNLLVMPLAFLPGGQGAALAGMSAPMGGSAYGRARDQGRDVGTSLFYGGTYGMTEYVFNRMPLHALFKGLKEGSPLYKTLAQQLAMELPREQAIDFIESIADWTTLNPNKTVNEFLQEFPDRAAQVAIATAVGSGGQTTILHGFNQLVAKDEAKVQKAEDSANLVDQVNKAAAASKLLQRNPERFEQFIEDALEDSPVQTIYLDANSLMQSGMAESLAELSPSVADQIQEAAQSGGMVRIPVAEYASRIAPSEHADTLLDMIKTDPDGFSRAEAREYMETQADVLEAEFEKQIAKEENQDELRASQQRVKDTVLNELNALGRFTESKNEIDATLIAARTAVRAAQLGVTPEQLFERQRLNLATESLIDGQIYGQDGQLKTDTQAFKNWFGNSKIVNDDGSPMVVYHGGTVGEVFDSSFSGTGSGRESGFFFTPDIRQARDYAGTGEVKEVYLSLKNPLYTDRQLEPAEVEQAKLDGHDGYWLVEDGLVEESEIVAFEPTQIKSVNNQGTFDPSDPNILRQDNASPRGAFNPESNTIALLNNADLSTFLHEAGHYFFESDIALASEIVQENRFFGEETSKEGEQQILKDVSTLLTWHGIHGDINQQLAEWHNLDFEERRSYHERTAESFEHYLFEGKTPSIELQRYFQQFRAWLLNVYKSIKDFLEHNPEAGKLNDEVRGVFDRMLASNEEIQLAEQGRAMMPLFRTEAEATNIGMTPEEFAQYQAQSLQSTQDAVQDLQSRGLRDMQWLHNARGREIKKLQRKAKELRSQARIEARREVMSQPLYRAWDFLTRKLEPEDKLPKPPTRASGTDVDPSRDSLLVAVAKLGGLRKDEAISQWGLDPKESPQSGVFGKPVLRRTDGLSIAAMEEALAELGYLDADHTKSDWNPNEFEEKFDSELRGDTQYSFAVDPSILTGEEALAGSWVDINNLGAGKLDLTSLREMDFTEEQINVLKNRRMTASEGLHPDLVAGLPGIEFTSGDQLIQELLNAETPSQAIEALTDVRMLEQHGELATPEAIEQEADRAIHNDARARMVATEANALSKATGKPKILREAAKQFAETMVSRVKVRDLKPSMYSNAASRAGKAAEAALRKGDLTTASANKRTQLVNTLGAKAAHTAREEIDKGVRYLTKFNNDGPRKGLDPEYLEQIDSMLERFDLRRGQSLKAIDRRTSLAQWMAEQENAGIETDIPEYLALEANRTHYKDMTIEQMRGLIDAVKQIEHLGRMKKKLLTAKDKREFDAIVQDMVDQVLTSAEDQGRQAQQRRTAQGFVDKVSRVPDFRMNFMRMRDLFKVLDGDKSDGPFWQYFVRELNNRVNWENTERAKASEELTKILKPLFDQPQHRFKAKYYPSLDLSLTREGLFAVALNMGNEGNLQRLLDGNNWTERQILEATSNLTSAEWKAVQQVWDYINDYRPLIAEKERRVRGTEPEWVEPQALTVTTADGETITLEGGYYPVVYDPDASSRADNIDEAKRAESMIKGSHMRATTRRSFTKKRADAVKDMPILLNMSGLFNGLNEVLHDLALNEWVIDANKLLNSKRLQNTVRDHYGPEVEKQLKRWVEDVAKGHVSSQSALGRLSSRFRHNVSPALLGLSIRTIVSMPFGVFQTIPVIGANWTMRGLEIWTKNPRQSVRDAMAMSGMLKNRARTRFRDLAEVRNKLSTEGNLRDGVIRFAYAGMLWTQQFADTVTWWGAYLKSREASPGDEQLAIDQADQAVIDSQSAGDIKDLPRIMREGELGKLFTFASIYMGSSSSLALSSQMSKGRARFVADMMWLYIVQASSFGALIYWLTAGGDDDKWDPEKISRMLVSENLSYLMGSFVGLRELWPVVDAAINKRSFDYSGPTGLKAIGDLQNFVRQVAQGELDVGLYNATLDLMGDFFGLPSAQIKRTSQGVRAISEGETQGPVEAARALAFGFKRNW